jgi:ABC-type arginine transport system ATPase subunit
MMSSNRPPYPGLRSFKREETDRFFGRDDCIDAMIGRLAAKRFLAVLGSSGVGKSSLVRTGLLSGLEMGLLEGAGSRWWVVDFRPEAAPMRRWRARYRPLRDRHCRGLCRQ